MLVVPEEYHRKGYPSRYEVARRLGSCSPGVALQASKGSSRMIKDGHWRTDGEQAEAVAWEESVRLRERMFWARIGGGVIPTFARARDSPRSSVEDKLAENPQEHEISSDTQSSSHEQTLDDPSPMHKDRTSVYSNIEPVQTDGLGIENASPELDAPSVVHEPPSPAMSEDEATKQLHLHHSAHISL